jgi:putative ABC transport system ATP-binding protein
MSSGLRVEDLRSSLAGPFGFTVPSATCTAITGPSGSGKSLMLRMIADLDPNEGGVWLDGQARASLPAPEWRRRVTYLAAESGWWMDRVCDHFQRDARSAVEALAERLGLGRALIDAQVAQLSSGEKQRLALIRALLVQPKVLLLDEPTGALDTVSIARVEKILADFISAGGALILVTHDPEQATRLGTAQLRMADRHLVAA